MSFETPPEWSGSPSGRDDDVFEGTWRYWQSYQWPHWRQRTACPVSPTDIRIPSAWAQTPGVGEVNLGSVRVIPADAAGIGAYRPQGSLANATAARAPASPCTARRGHRTAALRRRRRGLQRYEESPPQRIKNPRRASDRPPTRSSLRRRSTRRCRQSARPGYRLRAAPTQRIERLPAAGPRDARPVLRRRRF